MLNFVGCGDDIMVYDKIIDNTIKQKFEGIYEFEICNASLECINGGNIQIIQSDKDEIIVYNDVALTSVNPKNDTFSMHPKFNTQRIKVYGNSIYFSKDYNYTDGNDLEEDITGSNIRDKRRTDFLIEIDENDKLTLTIKIFSDRINNNPNEIDAIRIFKAKRV